MAGEMIMEPRKIPKSAKTVAAMEEIHRVLRSRILSEEYYLGEKLSENTLAREFGCSRTPIREAIKRLESENLIEIRPQSGTYVKMLTPKDYSNLLEVRAYLEGLSYRLAIERASDEAIAALEPLLDEMDRVILARPIEMQHFAELHYRFHFSILEMGKNVLLVSMFERLNLRSSHMFLRSMNAESAARTQEEHHRILNSLKARDPKGEKFMIGHLWRKKLYMAAF
jgi:DNA-binding GntR family transcriptional regulator